MTSKVRTALAAIVLFHAPGLQAQDSDTPSLRFNGFGTAGVVYSDEGQADFVSSLLAPDGAGHTRRLSPEVDTRLGLQVTSDLTQRLTGVLQLVAEQRHDDEYTPRVEWANLKLDITPNLSVRGGRMVLPVFMVFEYRKVGYAIPWVRPPQEVYSTIPVTNFDGVSISHRSRFAGFTNTLVGTYGRKDVTAPRFGEIQGRDGITIGNTLERGASSLFASYVRFDVTARELDPLFDAFRQFGPEGAAIAERYDVDDKRFEMFNIGFRYDPGDWFIMGEGTLNRSRTVFGDNHGWYLTAGYRLGSVTPYATLGRRQRDSATSDPGVSAAGLPPPAATRADELNAALNQLLGSAEQQKSVSLGARWDFARNAALKIQYDHVDLDHGSPGTLANIQPGFEPGGTVNLFSISLDFVF